MMEIHDELMTPGCPQCAVKHLSAALYWRAHIGTAYPARRGMDKVAIACINLSEVIVGYRSHLWYAVGALEAAEELADGPTATIRDARLMLEERGLGAVVEARDLLAHGTGLSPAEWEWGHLHEALRELPGLKLSDSLVDDIERIRKEYFEFNEAPAASDASAEKGGETDMTKKTAKVAAKAAVKAAAKKAVAKAATKAATKAACKGGKCKSSKAACKGGKCKDK